MSGDHLLRQLLHRLDLKRITASAYDAVAVGSTAVTFSRSDPFYVQGVLEGFTDATGSVEIIGLNAAGTSISMSLTFTGNQRRMNNQLEFASLSFINTSGLTNESVVGNLQVTSVSRTGQPREEFTIIRSNIPCRFSSLRENERIGSFGGVELVTGKVFMSMDGEINRRDKIDFRGETYNIRAIRKYIDRNSIRNHRVLLIGAEDQL